MMNRRLYLIVYAGLVVLSFERGQTALAMTRDNTDAALQNDNAERSSLDIVWPESYSLSYVFSLPYTRTIQEEAISYDVSFHKRTHRKRGSQVLMETMNGTNILLMDGSQQYEVVPRLQKQTCTVSDVGEETLEALPDISGWEYIGSLHFRGRDALLFQYEAQFEEKKIQYKFYVSKPDQAPLRLHAIGTELFSGAHLDEWVMDYTSYDPSPPHKHIFSIPDVCEEVGEEGRRQTSVAMRWHGMLPRITYSGGHAGYDAFLSQYGPRRHASLQEYTMRSLIFERNRNMIDSHNSNPSKTYTMAMNRFADWTREEFLAAMLPRHGQKSTNDIQNDKHEIPYEPLTDVSSIPSSVDWRGTPVAGLVKDQANCGSCWAFGAVGTLESAWNKVHGTSERFSEQQVMDCSWGYVEGNEAAASACNGGDAYAGIGHIIDAGGIASSSDYNYLGQGNYCMEKNIDKVATAKGYARIPQFNDDALREAVYSRGAVAISIDASQDSFTFYSEGVYNEPACMWRPDDLDHSVLLVGYGTDSVGGDYYIVKNSWSEHWGDEGYVKISRNNHGCGASTDAIYAVV
ncbi:hypothetical protein M9434_002163 [Picochlorum sp. BPE23]|nr:hypothetical protein M9434_002163 [Picochlorum sp. BPE23]